MYIKPSAGVARARVVVLDLCSSHREGEGRLLKKARLLRARGVAFFSIYLPMKEEEGGQKGRKKKEKKKENEYR